MDITQQATTEQQMDQEKSRGKKSWDKLKWKPNIPKLMGWNKSSPKRAVHSNKHLLEEARKVSNKRPNITPQGTIYKKKNKV